MSAQSKDPAILFYIDAFLTATAGMDGDATGWYTKLLLHHYDKGDLPNNTEELAVLAGVKYSEYQRFEHVLKHVLSKKFILNEETGRLENTKTINILKSREQFKEKRTRSGNIGVIIRLAKTIKGHAKYLDLFKTDIYALTDEQLEEVKNIEVIIEMFEGYGVAKTEKPDDEMTFVAPEFLETFKKWLTHKKGKRQNYKNVDSLIAGYRKLLKESNNDATVAALMVEKAIGNNYDGFHPLNSSEMKKYTTQGEQSAAGKGQSLVDQNQRIKEQFIKDQSNNNE